METVHESHKADSNKSRKREYTDPTYGVNARRHVRDQGASHQNEDERHRDASLNDICDVDAPRESTELINRVSAEEETHHANL